LKLSAQNLSIFAADIVNVVVVNIQYYCYCYFHYYNYYNINLSSQPIISLKIYKHVLVNAKHENRKYHIDSMTASRCFLLMFKIQQLLNKSFQLNHIC